MISTGSRAVRNFSNEYNDCRFLINHSLFEYNKVKQLGNSTGWPKVLK